MNNAKIRKAHPWDKFTPARPVGQTEEEEPQTSAVWDGSWLLTIEPGKPYADFIEFRARMQGLIVGRSWVGENPPSDYISRLRAAGRID